MSCQVGQLWEELSPPIMQRTMTMCKPMVCAIFPGGGVKMGMGLSGKSCQFWGVGSFFFFFFFSFPGGLTLPFFFFFLSFPQGTKYSFSFFQKIFQMFIVPCAFIFIIFHQTNHKNHKGNYSYSIILKYRSAIQENHREIQRWVNLAFLVMGWVKYPSMSPSPL